jgi:hypothetical protein
MTDQKIPQSSRSDQDSHLDVNRDYPPPLTHYQIGFVSERKLESFPIIERVCSQNMARNIVF